ncbi:hypothetical protein V6N13_097483 [Hibiscus sabdariffa]
MNRHPWQQNSYMQQWRPKNSFQRRQWQPDKKIHRRWLAQNAYRQRGIVTVYVANIPETLHRSGLRQTFGRHGDVLDSFIVGKQNKSGNRFVFVRFLNKVDAERTIERLNGFKLYGLRLSVSIARFKSRTSYWRNINKNVEQPEERERFNSCKQSDSKKQFAESLEESESKEKRVLRIEGYVHEENLLKLNKCAIGTMATACSSSSVTERLQERITWIQVEGIPLHCWNQTTFKRITESWGSLIVLAENGNQSMNCEKVTLLVSTKERNNLDDVLELEAGRDVFLIHINKLGFNIHAMPKANVDNIKEKNQGPGMGESSSASSSEK